MDSRTGLGLATQPLGARQNNRAFPVEWVGMMNRNLKNLQTQRQLFPGNMYSVLGGMGG